MILKDDYFFLSNFYPCEVTVEISGEKLKFKNAEAAYQAQKNYKLADKFCLLSGSEAKKLGRQIPLTTESWNTERLYAMAKALNSKFQNYALLFMLKLVKEEIIEDNYWDDIFWGICTNKRHDHEGKNILGKMLMNIRDYDNDYNCLLAYINKELIKLCMTEN